MQQQDSINEPARQVPVVDEVDVCVVGGSCTGVFAAVRAARLGARVALVEVAGHLGGTATTSLVNVWHSMFDTTGTRRIVDGLSREVTDELDSRGAAIERSRSDPSWHWCFNSGELVLVLERLVDRHDSIRPLLHARCVAVVRDGDRVTAAIIEDKSGRRAIRARAFVDATGDAEVVHRAGGQTYRHDVLQPPTMPVTVDGLAALSEAVEGFDLHRTLYDRDDPEALEYGFLWSSPVPGCPTLGTLFGTRVHGVDCSDADQLTRAEMEGRRQVDRMLHLLRKKHGAVHRVGLAALPARLGIRQTRQVRCLHRLTEREVLAGTIFDDVVARSTYRVDIHHAEGGGLTFRYLDGREVVVGGDGNRHQTRWRGEQPEDPTFYTIPYRSLVPVELDNVLVAGRCLDADPGAYGAVRVMIACNQMGEAAGVAAAQVARTGCSTREVDRSALLDELSLPDTSVE